MIFMRLGKDFSPPAKAAVLICAGEIAFSPQD
jgi:hypothetical protein